MSVKPRQKICLLRVHFYTFHLFCITVKIEPNSLHTGSQSYIAYVEFNQFQKNSGNLSTSLQSTVKISDLLLIHSQRDLRQKGRKGKRNEKFV